MSATPARTRRLPAALWPALGIGALVVANAVFDLVARRPLNAEGSFLHLSLRDGVPAGALIDVLNYGAPLAILALGMAPVIATRGVDLSVGSIMAISGAVAGTLAARGATGPAAIVAGMGAALACGLWNAFLVTVVRLQPFVATLVLMVAGRGVAQMITDSQVANFQCPSLEYLALGRPAWLPLPVPFIMAGVLLVVTQLAARASALGLLLEAVGANPEASRLAGVRSRTLIAASYVSCALCAGLAGLIAAADIKAADPFHAGQGRELAAIFGAVVGGTSLAGGRFSLPGAFVGALLLRMLTTTMYARNINDDIAPLPEALIILGVCALSPPKVRALFTPGRTR